MSGCEYYMGQVLWLRVAHTKSHSNTQDNNVYTHNWCIHTHTCTQNYDYSYLCILPQDLLPGCDEDLNDGVW